MRDGRDVMDGRAIVALRVRCHVVKEGRGINCDVSVGEIAIRGGVDNSTKQQ